ncbi:MAG: DNA methyltransferase [Bacteroidales bacterium]|nr:DNA methyltransferase [Bacteroidales bacterium]
MERLVEQTINIINDDCIHALKKFDDQAFDLIFADPPYNLSDEKSVTVKSGKRVKCDKGEWDKIADVHEFNLQWIAECKRVLKDSGTIWVTGTLHNHPSVGMALKKLGFWIINDIIWYKPNATPLLSKKRLAPSVELIWLASKSKKYYFDYDQAKEINHGKQMRNLWEIPASRHITNHPAEKPERLLNRIIAVGSKEKDWVLDPFVGSGTTGVVCKRMKRNFVGIEIDKDYCEITEKRIKSTQSVFC